MIRSLVQQIDLVCHDRVIVIGYGNTLRSDDGAGQQVAEIIVHWHLPQVRSISVHQLTPELAAPIAEAELAIFIDVYDIAAKSELAIDLVDLAPLEKGGWGDSTTADTHQSNPDCLLAANNVRAISIDPTTYKRYDLNKGTGHITDPHSLLYLTDLVYGKTPVAWWMLIPAVNFEFGDRLSTLTTAGIARAIPLIQQIIQSHSVNN